MKLAEYWIAVDEDGSLYAYKIKPYRDDAFWNVEGEQCNHIPDGKFDDMTWEDEPRKVQLFAL